MQQFFSFPVHASVIGTRSAARSVAKPRVLHFDPTTPAEANLLRFLQRGTVADSVRLNEVHTVAYNEAQPCSLIIVCKPSTNKDRILIDFHNAEDNRLFRVAFASVVLDSFDASMFHIAPVLVSKVDKRGLTGYSARHVVLVPRRMLLFSSESSPYPRQVLPLMSTASVSVNSKTRLLHLIGAYGEEVIMRCGDGRMAVHNMINAMQTAANTSPFSHASPPKGKRRLAQSAPEPVRLASLPALMPTSPATRRRTLPDDYTTTNTFPAPIDINTGITNSVPTSPRIKTSSSAPEPTPYPYTHTTCSAHAHASPEPHPSTTRQDSTMHDDRLPSNPSIASRPATQPTTLLDLNSAPPLSAEVHSRSTSVSEASLAPRRRQSTASIAHHVPTSLPPPTLNADPHPHYSDTSSNPNSSGGGSSDHSHHSHLPPPHHHHTSSGTGSRTNSARDAQYDLNDLHDAQSLLQHVKQRLASLSAASDASTSHTMVLQPQHDVVTIHPMPAPSHPKPAVPHKADYADDAPPDLIRAIHPISTALAATTSHANQQLNTVTEAQPMFRSSSDARAMSLSSTSAQHPALDTKGSKSWLHNIDTPLGSDPSHTRNLTSDSVSLPPIQHPRTQSSGGSSNSGSSSSSTSGQRAAPKAHGRKRTPSRATNALSTLLMSHQPLPSYIHVLPPQSQQPTSSTSTNDRPAGSRPRVLSAPARVVGDTTHPFTSSEPSWGTNQGATPQAPVRSSISVHDLLHSKESKASFTHKPSSHDLHPTPVPRSQSMTLPSKQTSSISTKAPQPSLPADVLPSSLPVEESTASTPGPFASKQPRATWLVTADEVGSWPTPNGSQVVEIRPNLSQVLPGVSIALRVRKESTVGIYTTDNNTASTNSTTDMRTSGGSQQQYSTASVVQGDAPAAARKLSVDSSPSSMTPRSSPRSSLINPPSNSGTRSPSPSTTHTASRPSSILQPLPVVPTTQTTTAAWPPNLPSTELPVSSYVNPLFVRQDNEERRKSLSAGPPTYPWTTSSATPVDRQPSPARSSPAASRTSSPQRPSVVGADRHPSTNQAPRRSPGTSMGGDIMYSRRQSRTSLDGEAHDGFLTGRHEVPSLGKHASAHIVNAAHETCENLSSVLSTYLSNLGGEVKGESMWSMSEPHQRQKVDSVASGVARVHLPSIQGEGAYASQQESHKWQGGSKGTRATPAGSGTNQRASRVVSSRSLVHRTSWLQGLLHGLNAGDITPHDFLHTLNARKGELLPDSLV